MSFKLPKPQKLRQESERGCAVPVFASLAGLSEDEVRRDLPQASLGRVSIIQWENWLKKRGFNVLRRDGAPTDILPCVHLVAPHPPRDITDFHWIYRDADGDVHDPSPAFEAMPADDLRMKNLSVYDKAELTLSVTSSSPNFVGCSVDSHDDPPAVQVPEGGAWIQIEIQHPSPSELFPGTNTMAAEYAIKHALEEWWPDIGEPARTKVRQIIRDSFEKRTAFSEVVDSICKAGAFSEARAKLIAETEIAQAQVGANWEVWKGSGAVSRVRWMAVGRDTCPVCKQNDGVVRTLGEEFPSGDVRPLVHPSCQCILSAVID